METTKMNRIELLALIINYNKCQKLEIKACDYCTFQRKNNCDWKLSTMYENKNMPCNYYFKQKHTCETNHDSLHNNKCENENK